MPEITGIKGIGKGGTPPTPEVFSIPSEKRGKEKHPYKPKKSKDHTNGPAAIFEHLKVESEK